MKDYDEHNKYFEYRKQRAIQTANFETQVDVAEAEMKGETGKAERDATKRRNIAQYDQEAQQAKNQRKIAIAKSVAELAEAEADGRQRREVADVNATMASRQREIELQILVEEKRREQLLASERAEVSSKKVIEAEMIERLADAHLYEQQREAEGTRELYKAQADGLQSVYEACGQQADLTQFYLALNDDLYGKLAQQSANAVQGLKPNMNIWMTGGSGSGSTDVLSSIKQLQGLGPVLDSFHHAGIQMPSWLPRKKKNSEPDQDPDQKPTQT